MIRFKLDAGWRNRQPTRLNLRRMIFQSEKGFGSMPSSRKMSDDSIDKFGINGDAISSFPSREKRRIKKNMKIVNWIFHFHSSEFYWVLIVSTQHHFNWHEGKVAQEQTASVYVARTPFICHHLLKRRHWESMSSCMKPDTHVLDNGINFHS